jgi:hypothetical protein
MKPHSRSASVGVVCVALLAFLAILTGCEPATLENLADQPTASLSPTEAPGYPGPSDTQIAPTVPPTYPEPTPAAPVTPPEIAPNPTSDPKVPVIIGPWQEVKPTPGSNDHFLAALQYKEGPDSIRRDTLLVTDTMSGRVIVLGDDQGYATFEGMSEKYVVWSYVGNAGSTGQSIATGLHAYDLLSGSDTFVGTGKGEIGYIHQDGDWLTYLDNSDGAKTGFWTLRAHNLATGEDTTLSQAIPFRHGVFPRALHDVYHDIAAWVEVDAVSGQPIIKVEDLKSRDTKIIKVPVDNGPQLLSISANYVIWVDNALLGYDFASNRMFTIPSVPPGWEDRASAISVVVRDDHLEWHWTYATAQDPYFVADLIRKQ